MSRIERGKANPSLDAVEILADGLRVKIQEFFEEFEESEIKEGSLKAYIEMDKRSSHLDLLIRITGAVMICWDRCLEMFSRPVECENRLLV